MRIGLDARFLLDYHLHGGVGHYAYQIIRHLPKVDNQNEYRLVFNFVRNKHLPRVRFVSPSGGDPWICRVPSQWLTPLLDLGVLPLEVLSGRVDVFHSSFFKAARPVSARLVVTVHDLMHVHHPEFFPADWLPQLEGDMRRTLRWADRILADSEFTKQDIITTFGIAEGRITVVYPGVDNTFSPRQSAEQIEGVRTKYGISRPYVLHVGTLEPKKNHLRLIQAFLRATEPNLGDYCLVLAGGRRFAWPDFDQFVKELLDPSRVIVPGYVPTTDLPALYAGATCFVFPSLFEGFGIPLLEAMASGTPVIASNVAAIPEVVGDAGVLVNPKSVEEIADTLHSVLSDSRLQSSLREKGLARVRTFSWEHTAHATVAAYRDVATTTQISCERKAPAESH